MASDVVVIGGGVIGSTVAYQLSRQGARVTLFEPGLAGQASAASAGVIAPQTDVVVGSLHDLAVESARLYGSLCEELLDRTGLDAGYRGGGLMYAARTEADELDLRRRKDRLEQLGIHGSWLDGARAADVEPAIGFGLRGALHFPQEHQVDVPALTLALRRAAADLGASIRAETVERLVIQGERVRGVTAGADRVGADEVVIANGAWAGRFASELNLGLPVRPVRGQMVGLRAAGSVVRTMLFAPEVYLVRKADGWIYVGATVEEAGFDAGPTAKGVRDLLSCATELVPALADATFLHTWAGLRPGTPDGLPIIGRHQTLGGVTIATGHFRDGALLAPITGELVADLVQQRRPRFPLAAFDPARFAVRAA